MPLDINGNKVYSSSVGYEGQPLKQVVTSGLIAYIDASNKASYPGSGSTIYDLSGKGANGNISGISFVSNGVQSYFNFPSLNDSSYIGSSLSQEYRDMTIVFQPDFSASGFNGLIATTEPLGYGDKSLRFVGNGSAAWTVANPGDYNDWAYTATTYYVNGNVSNTLVSGWNVFGGFRQSSPGFPASFPYFLGSSGYPTRNFRGKMALALLYNRKLSQAEQLQNYNALKGRFGL